MIRAMIAVIICPKSVIYEFNGARSIKKSIRENINPAITVAVSNLRKNDVFISYDSIFIIFQLTSPSFSIQTPILNSFSKVLYFDVFTSCQICNGACYFEDAIIGACR